MFDRFLMIFAKPIMLFLLIACVAQFFTNKSEVAILNSSIETLASELNEKNTRLIASTLNERTLELEIAKFNTLVENQKIDEAKKREQYARAMSKKAVKSYISKYIKDTDENSSECDNLNSILDNVILNGM